jgi:hypothetical protein
MQSSNAPAKIPKPFASDSASRRAIPTASQIGITPGAASLTDGFPPLTRTALSSGGVPPSGLDMNGALYLMSAADQWTQAGGQPTYDSAFSAAIGGYPLGAVLKSADGLTWWRSTVENNTSNPDTGGSGWVSDTVLLSVSADGTPAMDGTAARGSSTHGARADHVHPVDTTRAPLASPALTGTPTVPTAAAGTSTTQAASTAFVQTAVPSASPLTGDSGHWTGPGGLTVQWGYWRQTGEGSDGDISGGLHQHAITFPVAFTNAPLPPVLTLQENNISGTDSGSMPDVILAYTGLSASGFNYLCKEYESKIQNAYFRWQAWGYIAP